MTWPRARFGPGVLGVVALLVLASIGSATAHTTAPIALDTTPAVAPVTAVASAAMPSATPPASATVWLGLALAGLLGAAVLAPRRALVAVLLLALAVFAVEAGVHSVHHLTDRHAASQCVIASASVQVLGTEEPLAPEAVHVEAPTSRVVAVESDRLGSRPLRPDEGRAPPAA